MEAVPRLPMISFELKISPDRFPPEFSKLKQYIRDFYNEDAESYSTEIRNLETLRANAVHPAKDATGCSVLKKYYCQLHFLQSRFPIGKDEVVAISFAWKDAYGGAVNTTADIKFEMVNILYNIGALHTLLGAGDDRSTPEGLKMACTHFQCAAWAFQHLKDTYPQQIGVDTCISSDLMQFMYQLCLAQAQECILEKSMTDNRKATINAKVAAQIVDYYNLAVNALMQEYDGSIYDIVGSKLAKSWKKYIKFKKSYYGCISLLYQGMQSEEQQKMGERIAYYQGALDKLNDAIKLSKGLDHGEIVSEALVFTRDVVEGKRKAAKNENDFIYHEDIPELDSLPTIKGASLVKGIPFNVTDPEISGPDIFARLVPMKAHEVSSLYSEEKAKLLRRISSMIDSKDEEVVSFMSSLQLDYLKAHLDTGPPLPQDVVDRCAALSAKPDAIPNLVAAMEKLSDIYHDVDEMLKEIMELIKIEEASEKKYQEVMGPRPPSIVATDLTREANKYMEAHKKAAESNETLHKAMTQHIENLRVLQQPLDEIASNLPTLMTLNLHDDPSVKEVTILVDKVGEMRKQRAMLASQLRESICSDDITVQLVTRSEEKQEEIFEREMQKHNKYVSVIEQNLAAQDNILPALTDAYAKYASTRKHVYEIMRNREMMLSALISSYDAYEDLITKSNKGLDFYRKLETNLTKLLQRVKGTCRVQQEERETILAQNNKKIQKPVEPSPSSSPVPSTGSGGLKLKDYLQNRKSAESANAGYYTGSQITADNQQSWLPGVRPAPLGSEGTSTPKQIDYSLSSYGAPGGYGAYTNYGTDYVKDYGMPYNYQNPLSVDIQNLQYPSMPVSGSNNIMNPMSSPSPKQLGSLPPNNPYSTSGQNPGSTYYDPKNPVSIQSNSPLAASSYGSTASGVPSTAASASSVPQQYQYQYPQPVPNSTAPIPGQTYPSGPMGYSSSGRESSTGSDQAYLATDSQVYQSPSSMSSAAQSYSASPGQTYPAQNYQSPLSYQTPPSSLSYQTPSVQDQQNLKAQGYTGQVNMMPPPNAYQATPAQNYLDPSSQAYQVPSSQTTNTPGLMQHSASSQPSSIQSFPEGVNDGKVPQSNYQFSSSNSGSYQYPSTSQWPSNNYGQYTSNNQTYPPPSSSYGAPASVSNINPPPSNLSYSINPVSSAAASTLPTHNLNANDSTIKGDYYTNMSNTVSAEYAKYYADYSNVFPNVQFQGTPGTASSFYSNAGGKNTSETNSSSITPDGLTYANQYVAATVASDYQYYYTSPYGYQYLAHEPIPKTDSAQTIPIDQNSMTYIQASNNSTTMTFSQQQNGTLPSTPLVNKEPSNLDLLTGLDFSVTEAPSLQPLKPENKLVEQSQEKLANLTLDPKPSPSKPAPVNGTDEKKNLNKDSPPMSIGQIERPPQSRTPSKDPFSELEALSQFAQEVEKFEKFVEGLNSKTLNGPTPLDIKWNELQDLQDKDAHKQIISVARCYPMKNRFPDFLPYDSSRVELPSTKDDYINASHVKDLRPYLPNFIMTQAPLPSTYTDFWTMVIEQHIEIVVCLLADSQMNGEIYWAVNKTEDLIFGKIKISLQSINIKQHWIERIISVSDGKTSRVVVHLQFTSWPHSWMPESPGPFLSLVKETLSLWSQQRGRGPIAVHCDSGVGKTGLFVSLVMAIGDLGVNPHLPDPLVLSTQLAQRRKNPLRDRAHLAFAYHCILYYAQDLLMKRGILASRSTFEEKRTKTKSHTRHPSEDFLLNSLNKENNEERRQSDAGSSGGGGSKPNPENDPLSSLDPLWQIKRSS